MPNIPKTSGNGSDSVDLNLRGIYNITRGATYDAAISSGFDIEGGVFPHIRRGINLTPDYYYAGGSLTAAGTSDMVNNWRRFDHRTGSYQSAFSSDPSLVGQASGWDAAPSGIGITQPTNSAGLIGFVSPDSQAQQKYYIRTKITSTSSDNDSIGVILAWRTDGTIEYTLYAQRSNSDLGGLDAWSIVENFRGSSSGYSAKAVGTYNYATPSSWSNYTNGTVIEVISSIDDDGMGNLSRTFTCRSTAMNSSTLGDEISFTVNSSSVWYPAAPYGFAAFSQEDCEFGEIYIGENETAATARPMGFDPVGTTIDPWDLGRYRNAFYT